ncbi:unnamed protein product [Caenorhabditis bovis]|uniref:Uncharacterized protein n=1 Tax=Caenorhabditis bovis TaxID=2654633 RepID=A0A8S1EPF4_9PELO|nr:unnamed protein product [Caenorhabditis bovis]
MKCLSQIANADSSSMSGSERDQLIDMFVEVISSIKDVEVMCRRKHETVVSLIDFITIFHDNHSQLLEKEFPNPTRNAKVKAHHLKAMTIVKEATMYGNIILFDRAIRFWNNLSIKLANEAHKFGVHLQHYRQNLHEVYPVLKDQLLRVSFDPSNNNNAVIPTMLPTAESVQILRNTVENLDRLFEDESSVKRNDANALMRPTSDEDGGGILKAMAMLQLDFGEIRRIVAQIPRLPTNADADVAQPAETSTSPILQKFIDSMEPELIIDEEISSIHQVIMIDDKVDEVETEKVVEKNEAEEFVEDVDDDSFIYKRWIHASNTIIPEPYLLQIPEEELQALKMSCPPKSKVHSRTISPIEKKLSPPGMPAIKFFMRRASLNRAGEPVSMFPDDLKPDEPKRAYFYFSYARRSGAVASGSITPTTSSHSSERCKDSTDATQTVKVDSNARKRKVLNWESTSSSDEEDQKNKSVNDSRNVKILKKRPAASSKRLKIEVKAGEISKAAKPEMKRADNPSKKGHEVSSCLTELLNLAGNSVTL